MSFKVGDRVILTSKSEFKHQNKRNGKELIGEVKGVKEYISTEYRIFGEYDKGMSAFKYNVDWIGGGSDYYYNDEDLKLVEPLPVTNQAAKNRLSKEW